MISVLRRGAIIYMLLFSMCSVMAAKIQYSAIVIDAANGRVLHSEDADAMTYPASLTKMMTLYLLFEAIQNKRVSFKSLFHATAHATTQAPSKLGLKVGEKISAHDAMLALIVKSANDVAVTVAENLAGSEDKFAELMTKKARKLGMRSTTFKNASGLPHKQQKTTARDMAILGLALFKNFPQHYKYFKTTSFQYKNFTYKSHNKLVKGFDGCDGIKTGFINASGFNLVSSARRNGRRYIVAVLGGDTARARDHRSARLLELAFNSHHNSPFLPPAREIMYANAAGNNVDLPTTINKDQSVKDLNALIAHVDRNTNLFDDMDVLSDVQQNLALMKNQMQQVGYKAPAESLDISTATALNAPTTLSHGFQRLSEPQKTERPPTVKSFFNNIDRQRSQATVIQVDAPYHLPRSETSWSVQLGTFAKSTAAAAVLANCRRKFKSLINVTDSISLSPSTKQGHKKRYRARLTGFNAKNAASACKFFRKIGQPCLIIEPHEKLKICTAMN